MELILKYFPDLTEEQKKQFDALYDLYTDWNSKINVISRKDIENLYEHHVLHSLGIAQIIRFKPGTKIMDLGTGGGFPGIPLAILFPEVQFHLVDSIGKKVRVATEIANSIGLKNVTTRHARAEEHLPQTAECFSQWTNLPERRRIGERGDAFQKQNHHVEFERIL